MKLTFVTVSPPAVKNLIAIGKEIEAQYPRALELKLYYGASEPAEEKLAEMTETISQSDLVFIDLMGSSPAVSKAVSAGLEKCRGHIVPYGNSPREHMRLGKFTMEAMKSGGEDKKPDRAAMAKMRTMAEKMGKVIPGKMSDMRNYSLLMKYFKAAGLFNIRNMLYLLLREYGGVKDIPKPQEPREAGGTGLCDPKTMRFYDSFQDYSRDFPFAEDRPTVGVLFYGHTYPTDTSGCVAVIKNRLEEFANVLTIAVSGSFEENREKLRVVLLNSTPRPVDLILNFMSFRLGAGPMGGDHQAGIELLKEINVPYLHPYFMSRRTVKEWKESVQGCSISEIMISVMLPELDGCLESYPVGAMSEPKYNPEFDIVTTELEPIPERVEKLAARVKKHLDLRDKENKDKKIAVICYNYPPGESNLFGGAFLDTFASVATILSHLKGEGYATEALSKEQLMEIFTAGKGVNSGKYGGEWAEMIKYPDGSYHEQLKQNPDYQEMLEQWGPVPGRIMSTERHEFLIPGTIQGKVFIGLQPSRGIHEEEEKAYHDKNLLPHHQYLAFYQWLKEEFQADAVIHVGTHGTLEFLKGKESGMSGRCYPDQLLADLPHIYLYYCGNPSEATIAKRRSHANLVSYQPPIFVQGELYGEYSKLMTMIDNYRQSLALAPRGSAGILEEIGKTAAELNLPADLEELESELYRMNRSLIPKGLHVFGQGFSGEEAAEYVNGLLRYSRQEATPLRKLMAEARGWDAEELWEQRDYERLKELDQAAREVFQHYLRTGELLAYATVNGHNQAEFRKTLDYGRRIYEAAQENHELQGLSRTLAGEYNPAKLAGDIYRHPEILPTGYNLYQFDPRLIPTPTAYARGAKICADTLVAYHQETGTYPLSTGVILWGIESSRTQGETFAQILAYLGVRVSDQGNEWDPRYEIIPLEELGRPRIDVTINICGFFRDMFPNLIESLSDLLARLDELEEKDEENYFKANSRKLYRKLMEEGYSSQEAKELSLARVFGPQEGGYGTGLTKLLETKNWESEEQLGNMFISNSQHIYTRRWHGKKVAGLYEENLKAIDIVSQIRSSHEYEITDLDHYYEFFGGLAKSAEMVKGRKVKLYISDTTGERVSTEKAEKAIARGIRTRVLNPKWIDGMLEHAYHGGQKIAERFENIMGLAATTNSVDQWIFNDLHNSYAEDAELRQKMQENNPFAYLNIIEQMMEYSNRGYWQATPEQLDKLRQIYLEVEDSIEERV
ncbi:magnesium chelatase subunit H [Desulfitobacterium hafniense]|uniref:Cobalamin biosynthesis protein n=1 Tax=Desulfitobacterium hafniense TaxID=49338 RepID=A0A0W1JC60_DESHA|nr:magnesium chelatase subunit H [Desulfitobacterium hafniense]KTE89367.1 cobalamin biosynthesis protein [Desulfitobacterium hafniense]